MGKANYSARLLIPDGCFEPDMVPIVFSSSVNNFVVSRGKDEAPISYYDDLSWDFSSYHPRGQNSIIYFNYWDDVNKSHQMLIAEVKFILRNVIWLKKGRMLSIEVILKYGHAIRTVARYAAEKGYTVGQIISDSGKLAGYFLKVGVIYLKQILSLIKILRIIGSKNHGLALLSEDEMNPFLYIRNSEVNKIRQHAVIPSRIYLNIIDGLVRDINEYCIYKNEYITVLRGAMNDPLFGRSSPGKSDNGYKKFTEVTTPEFRAYLKKCGHSLRVTGLVSCLTRIQILCKTLIHVFSGMRDDEACFLPYNCTERRVIDGEQYCLIHGLTTKGGVKPTFWASCQLGMWAIEIAQELSALVYISRGENIREIMNSRDSDYPLFVGASEYFISKRLKKTHKRKYWVGGLDLCNHRDIFKRYDIAIQDKDISELEFIDAHRAWRSETEFKVGSDWLIKTHQFRRSLGVYGHNSGLIYLSSMRQQFQQCGNTMAEYYCSGSSHAIELLKIDSTHMCRTYQATVSEAEALGFIKNILLSKEKIIGPYVTWVDRNFHEIGTAISLEKREFIMNKFKNGEMSYRETYLGGCSKLGPCDKSAMRSLFSCIKNCSSASVKLTKLDRAIALHKIFLDKLDPTSIEWKAEKDAHDDLCDFKGKF